MEYKYETLQIEIEDGVAIVTLNRPDKMNALSMQMLAELLPAFETLRVDPDVKAVVITDVVSCVVLMVGAALICVFGLDRAGGWDGMVARKVDVVGRAQLRQRILDPPQAVLALGEIVIGKQVDPQVERPRHGRLAARIGAQPRHEVGGRPHRRPGVVPPGHDRHPHDHDLRLRE